MSKHSEPLPAVPASKYLEERHGILIPSRIVFSIINSTAKAYRLPLCRKVGRFWQATPQQLDLFVSHYRPRGSKQAKPKLKSPTKIRSTTPMNGRFIPPTYSSQVLKKNREGLAAHIKDMRKKGVKALVVPPGVRSLEELK